MGNLSLIVPHKAPNSSPNFFSRTSQKRVDFCLPDVLSQREAHNCRSERTKAHIRLLMPTSLRVYSVPKSVLSCPLMTASDPFRVLGFALRIRIG